MVMSVVSLLLLLVVIPVAVDAEVLATSTRTAYNDSLTAADREVIDNFNYLFVPSTCEPVYIDTIFRHGTRNPSAHDIEEANELADRIRGHIQNPNYAALNDWIPPYNIDENYDLVKTGYDEMYQLGQRYGHRFASLWSREDGLDFYTSSRQRCIDSCDSFRDGLANGIGTDLQAECIVRDDLTRYYNGCPYRQVSVEDNKDVLTEYDAFGEGPEMTGLLNNINQLLNFDNGATLSEEDMWLAYSLLGFDLAGNGSSAWEGVMNDEQLDIMNYWSDIEYYWTNAFVYPINWEVACTVMTDTFRRIDEVITAQQAGLSHDRALFQSGHTDTVMRLAALIGLNEGTFPLRHDNFNQDHEFQTSRDGPYGSNIAFTLYKCDSSRSIPSRDRSQAPPDVTWPNEVSDWMIQLLYKEIPVQFPFADSHLVALDDVRSVYGRYIDQCDIDSICRTCYGDSAAPTGPHAVHVVTASILYMLLYQV